MEEEYFDGMSELISQLEDRGIQFDFDMIGNTEFIRLPAQVLRIKGGDDRGAVYFSTEEEFQQFKKEMAEEVVDGAF